MEYAKSCERYISDMLDSGSTPEEIRKRFLDFGWHPESVEAAFKSPRGDAQDVAIGPDLTGLPSRIASFGSECSVVMRMHHPDVCLLANVLSESECHALIELARPKLNRSKVYVTDSERSSEGVVSYVRTSQQAGFKFGETAEFDVVYERLSGLLRWPVTHMESLHVVRYLPGADFAPHHDFFAASQALVDADGQRLASVVVYLNTPDSGGATSFLDVQLEIFPQRGSMLFFSYLGADEATKTLHAGVPLGCGEKWIATIFLKDRAQVSDAREAVSA